MDSTPDIRALLGVWAHPDDEAYLSAGLTASVRRAGGAVVVATATHGEDGTDDPVDVHEHHCLGHRDGTLSEVPLETGVHQVRALLDAVGSDTVVTFGPVGMTRPCRPPHRLPLGDRGVAPRRRPLAALVRHADVCTGELAQAKYAALRAHASRRGPSRCASAPSGSDGGGPQRHSWPRLPQPSATCAASGSPRTAGSPSVRRRCFPSPPRDSNGVADRQRPFVMARTPRAPRHATAASPEVGSIFRSVAGAGFEPA